MGIDHVILPVADYAAGKRFYEEALRPLGFSLLLDWPDGRRAWFGIGGEASSLWLAESASAGTLALCLSAGEAETVDTFHRRALGVGARSSWEPGIRPEFDRGYYAARVHDPDGNAIEVVFRGEAGARAVAA